MLSYTITFVKRFFRFSKKFTTDAVSSDHFMRCIFDKRCQPNQHFYEQAWRSSTPLSPHHSPRPLMVIHTVGGCFLCPQTRTESVRGGYAGGTILGAGIIETP